MKRIMRTKDGNAITLGAGSTFIFDAKNHCLLLNAKDNKTFCKQPVWLGSSYSATDDKLFMPFVKTVSDFRQIMFLVFRINGINEDPIIKEEVRNFYCEIPKID